jgi:hypothetical protein
MNNLPLSLDPRDADAGHVDPVRESAPAPGSVQHRLGPPSTSPLEQDINTRRKRILLDAGGMQLSPVQNTSRAENTPQNGRFFLSEQPPSTIQQVSESGPEVARDRQALLHLIRMRVLSFDQLSRLTYFTADKTVARRRLRRLRDRGWIDLWDRPVAFGGTPRYAYPTFRALLWGHDVLASATEGTALESLVRLMTPATPRHPWAFKPGVIPMFLPHTEEANEVVIAWLRRSQERVLWASSWDCPFPDHVEWRSMPQPDYVLVLERDGVPELVFGEHDRGTEARDVVAKKFRTFRAWLDSPQLAERTFGFRTFHIVVTVSGERALRRLDQLTRLAQDEGVADSTTLLLATPDITPKLARRTPLHEAGNDISFP